MINKEVLKQNIPVLIALCDDKTIQFKNYSETRNEWKDYKDIGIGYPAFFDNNYEWRIKPEPSYRLWKPEEVPVGAQIKGKNNSCKTIILANFEGTITIVLREQLSCLNYYEALNLWEHSTDNGKTWQPCGVPV